MAFSDYSSTPSSNTTIAGLAITENNTALATLNNAIRQLMADGRLLSDDVDGLANPMPLTGGAFTGDITRSGKGAYLVWNSTGQTSGRIFIQASGGSAPSMSNGDILLEY